MDPPKRRYTMSARVLAANRANLVKARAVDPAIRFRATERRLEACRRNLLKAHQARRASPRSAGRFRHRRYGVSLRRSFALAREKAADFAAHFGRFDGAFRPVEHVSSRLVRALAETVWRRLRAFRLHALWEARAVQYCLARGARAAREGSAALQGGRGPAAGLEPGVITAHEAAAARAERLGFELLDIFTEHFKLERAVVRFMTRVERLSRALLGLREGCGGASDFSLSLPGAPASECRMADWPLEVLKNPPVDPGRIAAALRAKEPSVKPVEKWREWGTGRARRLSSRVDLGADAPPISAFDPGSVEQFEALLRAFKAALAGIEADEGSDPGTAAYSLIVRIAEATWERLQCFWHWAEVEAETLEEILNEQVAQSFASQKLCGFSSIPNPTTAEFERDKLCATSSSERGPLGGAQTRGQSKDEGSEATPACAPTARGGPTPAEGSPTLQSSGNRALRPAGGRHRHEASADPTTTAIEGLAMGVCDVLAGMVKVLRQANELNEKLETAFGELTGRWSASCSPTVP